MYDSESPLEHMSDFLAYIRVSTQKQGEKGSSLSEQRDAISQFAGKNGLTIAEWFEETETAAKQGRTQFSRMMRLLSRRKARGVIFHKIDRGARNLKDWNDIQELIEAGLDVRFAHESLDMQTRGGRLTADLLAVIASDYIRNLRDEVRKGMRGRLKQGLYPLQAPLGYLDQGGGKPKIPDPIRAPFIRQTFELYATGAYGLHALEAEMYRRGLRGRSGKRVRITTLAGILRRKFYIGVIDMKRSGILYTGIHEPIITRSTFERVQNILDGKLATRSIRHDFLFRRMIRCQSCGYFLIGELQKGSVYYRCHTKTCPRHVVREDTIEREISEQFGRVSLSELETNILLGQAHNLARHWGEELQKRERARELARRQLDDRLSRLTDAFLDGIVEKELFEEKKNSLIMDRATSYSEVDVISALQMINRVQKFLELAKTLKQSYESSDPFEKRDLLQIATSNLTASGKKPLVELRSPFFEFANRKPFQFGPPERNTPRTFSTPPSLKKLLNVIVNHVATPEELGDGAKYFQ